MRILHITPYSSDAWAYGGIPRIVGTLAGGLARRGHLVTVCTTDACDIRIARPGHRGDRGCRRGCHSVRPNRSNCGCFPICQSAGVSFSGVPPAWLRQLHEAARRPLRRRASARLPQPAGVIAARHLRRRRRSVRARAERHGAASSSAGSSPSGLRRGGRAPRVRPAPRACSPCRDAERATAPHAWASDRRRSASSPIRSISTSSTPPVARGGFRERFGLGARPARPVPGQDHAAQAASTCWSAAFAQLAALGRARSSSPATTWGAGRRPRAASRAGLGVARTSSPGCCAGRARLEALADADVRRLSVGARNLRARAARGAAVRHAGHRRRRFRAAAK